MSANFEMVQVASKGEKATIWSDSDLLGISDEFGVLPGTVGVGMNSGTNGLVVVGKREALLEWAEDLIARLRAGEGASTLGKA